MLNVCRTSFTLVFTLVSAAAVSAEPTATPAPLINPDTLWKVVIALASVLVANAVIPSIKAVLAERKEQNTFLVYLRAHVEDALRTFGDVANIEHAATDLGEQPEWLAMLKGVGLGAPQALVEMHRAIIRAEQAVGDDRDYIPYLSYFGSLASPLDHTSPLWRMSKKVTLPAMNYMLTQQQLSASLAAQYQPDYLELMKSGNPHKRAQWCHAARDIIFDMAEHYVAARKLKKQIGDF